MKLKQCHTHISFPSLISFLIFSTIFVWEDIFKESEEDAFEESVEDTCKDSVEDHLSSSTEDAFKESTSADAEEVDGRLFRLFLLLDLIFLLMLLLLFPGCVSTNSSLLLETEPGMTFNGDVFMGEVMEE